MTDELESVAAWNRAVEDLEWGEVVLTVPESSKPGRGVLLTAIAAAGVVTLAVLLGHPR